MVTAVSVLPAAQAQTPAASGTAAELKVLSPRSGDAVGSRSFALDVSFHARSESAPVVTAELWVDGVRWVRQDLDTPQLKNVLKFDVDGSSLSSGSHTVLVKVYTASGAVSQAQIQVEAGNDSGVSTGSFDGPQMAFTTPGNGKHVSGTVSFGLNAQARNGENPYVTFYVDKQFKGLKNYPPYTLDWDTTTVANGYHTVEATGYLESSSTTTTTRLRVYVDNPGGNTKRLSDIPDLRKGSRGATSAAAVATAAKPAASGPRAANAVLPAPKAAAVATRELLKPIALDAPSAASAASAEFLSVAPGSVGTAAPLSGKAAPAPTAADTAAVKAHWTTPRLAQPTLTARPAAISAKTGSLSAPRMATLIAVPSVASATAPSVNGVAAASRATIRPRAGFALAQPAAPADTLLKVTRHSHPRITASAPRAGVRPASSAYLAERPLQVAFDGDKIAFDVQPRVEAGLPIAPFRQIFEHTGGQVDWIASTQVVHAVNADREVVIRVGQSVATVNGEKVQMGKKAFVESGRTIVPLSFVGKALNVDVKYDAATGHLSITSK